MKRPSVRSNQKKAEMIKLLGEIGPEVTQIASKISTHKETVRYWYHSLLQRGFTVNAIPNYEALGLKRFLSIVKFDEPLAEHADVILTALSELAYLTSFAKTVPESCYIVNFSVPQELLDRWSNLMDGLRSKGVFSHLKRIYLGSVRNPPMKAEHFNFDSGTWEFEWSSPRKVTPEPVVPFKGEVDFDEIDLQIIMHLQLDANTSLSEIGKKLSNINYKTLDYHFRTHILGKKLVKGYVVSWLGTAWDSKLDKARHRKHRYLAIELLVKDISETEKLQLTGMLNSIPFLWLEGGDKNYYAKMVFPLEQVPEALRFLEEVVAPFQDRAKWFFMDQEHAVWFTIIPRFYDEGERDWRLEEGSVLARFDKLLLQIRGGGS